MAINPISALNKVKDFADNLQNDLDKSGNSAYRYVTDNTSIYSTGRYVGANEVIKRFHLGNEFGSASSNPIFIAGFEDPSFLTFKIEFGDWGFSLWDLDFIRTMYDSRNISNVYIADYDQFPMGLLNINNIDFNKNLSWNDLALYNAYNYLMNRNEDVRALYIKTFAEGLFVLLKDMPYIFQKINGIDKLLEFNATRGQRLKDVKISIECIEGIDLKIKTLLEAYRKAAYDDVWQRWVLPDIYRYFKMIIYVFDRRILLTGAYAMYSPELDDFPIYALECGPCEIDIESILDGDFSVIYGEHKEATSKITINVKNVKTYYANALFNKLDPYMTNWFADLETRDERLDVETVNSKNNTNYRKLWMQRMFMIDSDYEAFQNGPTHKAGDYQDQEYLYRNADWIKYNYWPEDTWHYANVSDSIWDIHDWKSFKTYMKHLITSRRKLVRDSRTGNRDVIVNDLIRPDERSYYYDPIFNPVRIDYKKVQSLLAKSIKVMINKMLNNTYIIDNTTYVKLQDPGMEFNLDKVAMKYIYPIFNEAKTDLELVKPDLNTDHVKHEYVLPELNTDHIEHEYVSPIFNDEHVSHEYVLPELNTDHVEHEYVEPELNTDHVDHEYVSPILNLSKTKLEYVNPIFNLDKPEQELVEPEFNLEKAKQELVEPEFNLDKPEHEMIEPIMNLDKSTQVMIKPKFNLNKPKLDLIEPIFNLEKFELELIEPVFNLEKIKQNLIEPIFNLEKIKLNLIKPEFNLDKPKQELVEPIIDTHKEEHEMVKPVIEDEHVEMNMVEPIMETDHADMNMVIPEITEYHQGEMNMVKPVMDTHKEEHNMVEPIIDTHKETHNFIEPIMETDHADMNMVEPIIDTHKEEHEMVKPVIEDEHQLEMNFVKPVMDITKNNMQMTELILEDTNHEMNFIYPIIEDEHQPFSQMTEPIINDSKAVMDMIPVDQTVFKPLIDMIPLEINDSKVTMDMTHTVINDSKAVMDMTHLDISTSLPEMDMVYLDTSVSKVSMNMTDNIHNPEKPEMDMVHTVINDSKSEIDMVYLDTSTSKVSMDMMKLEMNTNKPEMDMVHTVINDSKSEMTMTDNIHNPEKPEMDMTLVELNLSKFNAPMTELNEYNYDVTMSYVQPNLDYHKNNMSEFVKPEETEYKQEMRISENILLNDKYEVKMDMTKNIHNPKKPEMDMIVPIINDEKLEKKIHMLTSISESEVTHADIDQLISLADIINETVKQVKDRLMDMIDNKPNIPPHVHMQMTSIKQPPRRTFVVEHLINEIDDAALDRAFANKHNNDSDNPDNNSYTSRNRKGTAL